MSLENPLSRESEINIFTFILKLAQDSGSDEKEIVDAIVHQLHKLSSSSSLPDIIDRLDPSRYHSETKLLEDSAKDRLTKALDIYTSSK